MSEAVRLRPSRARPSFERDGESIGCGEGASSTPRGGSGNAVGPTPAESERGGESRLDLLLVADMVEPGSRVLDVGCGDGALLALLRDRRQVDGRGIEISRENVSRCLAKGLPVIQGDADTDLADYPNDAFDYVILSQTIQATRQPRVVLENLLRIGQRAIVSFPNFGHWRIRYDIGLRGRMPTTENLPHSWYDTPNIHFCTIRDFVGLCRDIGAKMEKAIALNAGGQPVRVTMPWWVWNLFGEQAVFLLRRR
jgi:methionine biosynthesis protein MetW